MGEKTREKRGKIRHVKTRNRGGRGEKKEKSWVGLDRESGIYRAEASNRGWRKISISRSTLIKIESICSISSDFIGTIALVTTPLAAITLIIIILLFCG